MPEFGWYLRRLQIAGMSTRRADLPKRVDMGVWDTLVLCYLSRRVAVIGRQSPSWPALALALAETAWISRKISPYPFQIYSTCNRLEVDGAAYNVFIGDNNKR